MSFFNADQLTRMRADVANLLPDSCVIYSPSYASDGAGGGTLTYSAVGTVACRVDPINLREQIAIQAQGEKLKSMYQLTLPYDTTIAANYQVVTGGKTYQVEQMDIDHSGRVSRRAKISEVS